MLDILESCLAGFKWDEAGGSSFVELTTGLNIALAGWEQFQDKLNYPRNKCEEIINSTTSSIQDRPHKNAISTVFRAVSKPVVKLNELLWCFAFLSAIAASIVGVVMLWSNLYFGHDWILILPVIVHLVLTTVILLIFKGFAKLVNWCCSITNSSQIEKEIKQLDTDTATKPVPNGTPKRSDEEPKVDPDAEKLGAQATNGQRKGKRRGSNGSQQRR